MNIKISVIFLLVLNTLAAFGQVSHKQNQAERSLNEEVDKAGLKFISNPVHVGLSIGIVENGSSYAYNYGSIEKDRQVKPTAKTIYEIASITKSFTGILLAHAVAEGKISLNDDVTKYLDGSYPGLAYEGHSVKISNLANHTSGLPKNVPDYKKDLSPEEIIDLYKDFSEKRFLDELAKIRINRIPGSQFNYSNAGAQLIGIILEKVYHMSYADLVKKYITKPNHMEDTRLSVSYSDEARFAKGYNEKGVQTPLSSQWVSIPAAGSLKSTVDDLLSYLKLNMNEKDHVIALAHQVTFKHSAEGDNDIGLFWFSKTLPNGTREVMHAGGSFGTTTYCLVCPSQHIGIVCLCNDAAPGTEHELTVMCNDLLSRLYKK